MARGIMQMVAIENPAAGDSQLIRDATHASLPDKQTLLAQAKVSPPPPSVTSRHERRRYPYWQLSATRPVKKLNGDWTRWEHKSFPPVNSRGRHKPSTSQSFVRPKQEVNGSLPGRLSSFFTLCRSNVSNKQVRGFCPYHRRRPSCLPVETETDFYS